MPRTLEFMLPKKGMGLGWLGSKRLISYELGNEIEVYCPDFDIFVDPFGGGGAVSCEFLMRNKTVRYNDKDNGVYQAFKYALTGNIELQDVLVDRDTFYKIRQKEDKTPMEHLQLIVNSFGNKRETYLYREEHADMKYRGAMDVLKYEPKECWGKYLQTKTFKKWQKEFFERFGEKVKVNESVARLIQTERLQQMEQLQQQLKRLGSKTGKERITFDNEDYKEFIPKHRNKRAVLYCDIPYRDTHGYKVDFNHDEFFEFIENEKPYFAGIFFSSYNEPSYKCLREFKKVSTLGQGTQISKDNEKLYAVSDFEKLGQIDLLGEIV